MPASRSSRWRSPWRLDGRVRGRGRRTRPPRARSNCSSFRGTRSCAGERLHARRRPCGAALERSARLTSSDVVATLDLRAARPGRRLFQLTPENVRVPFGVEVVQVTPSSIAMVFETSATRADLALSRDRRQSAPGFVVGAVTTDPKTIEVTRARERGGASDRGGDRGGLG